MNPINRRLDRLETAAHEQANWQSQKPRRQTTVADLNAIYDRWAHGTPLPPRDDIDPEEERWLNALYDRIVASQQERARQRNG
jgi:hypothetical protein